ncbi:hypothetical protein MVEG_08755 [Podila verticillata NRRL 6337]|nr:hypothetical protein MVEG_08755 [Podila verticillata NRRL 6337]
MSATTSANTTLVGTFTGTPTGTPTGTATSNSTFSSGTSSASTLAPTTSSGSSSDGTLDAMTFTGVPLRTVFYFIAFMALIMAIFYTIFIARRDRRRRQRNRADTEAGRHTSTYRPDADEDSPPGYRSYMLDQPYVDAEMVVIHPPQDAHFDEHLNALEQQLSMEHALNNRSLLSSYTTTTTTTTLATFMPGASSSGVSSVEGSETVSTEPVFIARPEGLVATASLSGSTSGTSSAVNGGNENNDNVSVIAEPAPAASFLSGRHLSILRFGLRGSNNIRSGSSSHRNSRLSETSSPSRSRSPSPALSSPRSSTVLLNVPEISGESQPQMTEVTSSSSLSHPVLHRLRSQGPPPYVPSTEEAPPLPPSYNHAVDVPQQAQPDL